MTARTEGQNIYTYKSNDKQVAFYMHPTRAWNFVIEKAENVTKKELNKLLNEWLRNAIGSRETLNDRIKTISIS
jgi:hypothetical protein